MKKYLKVLAVFAAFIICAVMYSCGNKSDLKLSLTDDTQDEAVSGGVAADGSENAYQEGENVAESSARDAGADIATVVSNTDIINIAETDTLGQNDTGTIFVHVCGAVRNPDVYEVSRDARVIDAIKLAGGFTDEADSDYLNLAGGVTDGQKIYVPTEQEVSDGTVPAPQYNTVAETTAGGVSGAGIELQPGDANTTDAASQSASGISQTGKVNINTATEEELKTLNGIGDKRARDIIDYRNNNGGFKSIEEIKNVNGIKDGLYNKICDSIEV